MIYPIYAGKDDMTFIMKEENNKIEVIGFYFGKPSEGLTREYQNNLIAFIER